MIIPIQSIALMSIMLMCMTSCFKDRVEPHLPPITQTGENTFGMLVDGELFLPSKQPLFIGPTLTAHHQISGERAGNFVLFAKRFDEDGGGLLEWLIFDRIVDTGYYPLVKIHPDEVIVYQDTSSYSQPNLLDTQNIGYLHISRLDTVNFIISGTFEFSVLRQADSSRISITEGRFDIKHIR